MKCSVDNCNDKAKAKGYCAKHYYRVKKHGDPNVVKITFEPTNGRTMCSIALCGKPIMAKGLCSAHYAKLRKYGDPLFIKQVQFRGSGLRERFDHYVVKIEGKCWKWTAFKDKNGYARLMVNGKSILAHRVSWFINRGEIPTGVYVLHACDNPECTNPEHLFLGNQKKNMVDMWTKGRANPGHVFGESHGMSKLIAADVIEIRSSTKMGVELSKQFGVSPTQISDIRNFKTWKHLTSPKGEETNGDQ